MDEQSVNALAEQVMQGVATEEERATALKAIQVAMSATLVNGMGKVMNTFDRINSMTDKLANELESKLESLEVFETQEILDMYKELHSRQLQTLDLYRKIVQGKDLFNAESISAEEKQIIKLMNSFSSVEEKQAFLKVVKETLEKQNQTKEEPESFDE